MSEPYYSHTTMEQIKIPVTIDGDLAISLLKIIAYADENNVLDKLLFCGHSAPKLDELFELLVEKTDIENREEV